MSHPSGASAGSEEGDLNWDLPPTAGGGIPGEAVSEEGQQYIELPPVTPNDFDSQASPPCGSPCSVHSDCGAEYLPPLPPLTIANLNLNDLAAELGEPGLFGGTGTGLDNPAVMDALPSPGTSLISPGHDIPDEISLFPGDPAPSFEQPHWSEERTTCKHLDGFEERALVKEHALLDNFRKWGSEVCLKMWNRHHPFCRTLLITENGRESIERDAWNRSYIKHRNTKFKNECAGPGRYCKPCILHQMDIDNHKEWIDNNESCFKMTANIADSTYWVHRRYELYNVPPVEYLEKNFNDDQTDKLSWFELPYDVRICVYELLLVNCNHYTQQVQNIQIGDDQGPHELVFRPQNLRVELGNTFWNHHCRDGRYDDVPHNPCREELHYPCTGIWPAILRTNKKVYQEAGFIMYRKNVFEVSLSLESSGDPWYTLWGKYSERRDDVLKKKVLGRAINHLYNYPEPGPLLPPMMELDDMIRAEGGDPYNMSDDGTRTERQHDSESGGRQSNDGSGTALDNGPDTQGAEVSITDSDMLSQASTTEPHYPCDQDPELMPSWLSRLRLVAFLRKIGGRNASQIANIYVTVFDTHDIYTMMPIFTSLFRQHMSRLTTIQFELCHEEHGVETDASSSLPSDQQETEVSEDAEELTEDADGSAKASDSAVYDGYPEDFDMLYPHLQWLIERVGSLKSFTYRGHWNFGKNPRFKKAHRLMAKLDVPLADRRSYVASLDQLNLASYFIQGVMRDHKRGKKLGSIWMWRNADKWLPWAEGEVAEKVRGIRGLLKMEHFEEFERRRLMREKKLRAKERREERRREAERVGALVGGSQGVAGPEGVQGAQGVAGPEGVQEAQGVHASQEVQQAQEIQEVQQVQEAQEAQETQDAQQTQDMEELPKAQALEEVQEIPSTPTMEVTP